MKVTVKIIRAIYPDATITQVDSKQMFIVVTREQTLLLSYSTIVGKFDLAKRVWALTKKKYSITTSKQLSMFARNHNVVRSDDV